MLISEDWLNSWREEKQSAWLYARLAAIEPQPRIARLYESLGHEAEKQAEIWLRKIAPAGESAPVFSPSLRARFVLKLATLLGPKRVTNALAALKVRGLSVYAGPHSGGHAHYTSIDEVGQGHSHRHGGNLRAAVFGINDGLVSNTALMLGVLGADYRDNGVLIAGLAGWLAGALSMAAGEFVSVRSQTELYEHQIALEAKELEQYPEAEATELALIYAARGLPQDEAEHLARQLIGNPKHALDVLAREELGLNPEMLGSPWSAAGFSFVAFTIGALVPLLPFLIATDVGTAAVQGAMLAGCGLFVTGVFTRLLSGRNLLWGGLRMLLIGGGAGLASYLVGTLFGQAAAN